MNTLTAYFFALACAGLAFWSYYDIKNLIPELLGQARLHISVLYCLFALYFLLKKRWVPTLILLIAIAFNAHLIMSGFPAVKVSLQEQQKLEKLRILSFNIYMHNPDLESISKNLKEVDADIILLVEVSETTQMALIKKIGNEYPYQFPNETTNYLSSISVFSKYPILGKHLIEKVKGSYKRIVHAPVQVNDKVLHVYGVHMISPRNRFRISSRNHQIEKIGKHISEKSLNREEPVIVVGDMNTVSWNPTFLTLLQVTELKNSDRYNSMNLTWPSWLPWPLRIPIDHILHNDAFCGSESHQLTNSSSDHFAIYSDLYWCEEP